MKGGPTLVMIPCFAGVHGQLNQLSISCICGPCLRVLGLSLNKA